MESYLIAVAEALLLPPGLMITMILLGVVLLRRWYHTGTLLMIAAFVMLVAASLPAVGNRLLYFVEVIPPISGLELEKPRAGAIVVLGGGRHAGAPEYGGADTVSAATLARMRYAIRLHRRSGLPLLLSGGDPHGAAVPEAELMQQVLTEAGLGPARWMERASRNTWEAAVNSRAVLATAGVDTIILVTDAAHMPRARMAFTAQGFTVVPAPTGFHTAAQLRPLGLALLPSAEGLKDTRTALREWLGQLWYRLRYGAG